MNFEEIKVKLKELGLTNHIMGSFGHRGEYYYDNNQGEESEVDVKELLKNNFGEVKVVDKGYFHDGYECYVVYHFIEHEVYVKYDGYYSSYDGSEWTGSIEVFPEQKTITVYNSKKKEN